MPAARTRGSKRTTGEGLRPSTPIDLSKPQSIAFAPNVTPGTFNDPPSPVTPTVESSLFPSIPPTASPSRRQAHSKKKPENHIPRPPNAFILFRSSFIKNQHVSSEVETNHSTLSKIIGLTWQNLPHEEREIWHAKAKAALDEHKRKFPEYSFRPLHPKAKVIGEKRKVREVSPKDMKRCAKIAELLVKGKKGAALDAAIQEFDRHHVPEIVTRFETPITARSFRRSSSAPVADAETPAAEPLKARASSSRPETLQMPSTPSSGYPSPSPLHFDVDYSPSSPSYESQSQSSTYSLTESDPSFDFDTFTFSPSAAMPMESCDPFAASQQTDNIFSSTIQKPVHETYTSSSLTIDTTFLDEWAVPTPPLSSAPSSPHSYPDLSVPDESFAQMDFSSIPPLLDMSDVASMMPMGYSMAGSYSEESSASYQFSYPSMAPYEVDFPTSKGQQESFYGAPAMNHADGEFSSMMGFVPTYGM
ncbi:hypothetical protein CERSUDRAFT_116408 [Gelatoporia subvermispora B]|uniref:HMG box domain-containing protein n=1 Tax=Ceriporiopsis subvermispora (strain B) TaxID=914234 RepID=M2RB82_CERS8|nr:hypothetical protein CERSUDRAFT_116408 [Gelatoporia subvermispora B]